MQARQSVRVFRQQARSNVYGALWAAVLALSPPGIALAADGPSLAIPPEPEGSSALQPGQVAPLVGIADPMAGWQATWQLPAQYSTSIGGVSVLQVRPDIYMLTVGGLNVAVQTGWQGTLVINTAGPEHCDELVQAVQAIARAPIRYIVNTSADVERVACNASVAKAGHAFMRTQLGFAAPVIAHQNTLVQLLATGKEAVPEALPSELFTRPVFNLYLNEQAVQIFWMPAAHSDGDTMVMFRRSDVVVTGDILDTTRFPVIDLAHGGTINGEIAALNRLLEEFAVAVNPKFQSPGGTLVVPGRGQLSMQTDVLHYRDMVTIIRDRVQALKNRGASLAQVQQSEPARGYTTRYGSQDSRRTAQEFVAAIYRSLPPMRPGARQ